MSHTNVYEFLSGVTGSGCTLTTSLWVTLAVLFLAISTRLSTAKHKDPPGRDGNVYKPPLEPYWFPIVGHLLNMAFDADAFVQGLRDKYRQGIFTLNFGGYRHNIIHTPDLVTALLNQKVGNASGEDVNERIMLNVFGLLRRDLQTYKSASVDILACYQQLMTDPGLATIVHRTERRLRESTKDLVTGNESPVDMMPWERQANLRNTIDKSGRSVVEADLLSLLRDYMGHVAMPSVIGSNFLDNFPDFLADLWTFDQGAVLMGLGLPRWLPVPSVTRAHIARRRMLERLRTFHIAMERHAGGLDPGPRWANLDDVSPLHQAQMIVYRKHRLPVETRAALELGLIWAMNANANALLFWMLQRIYSDKALLAMIREEISPHVRVVRPEKELAFAEPPQFDRLDVEGLCNNCPLLKACYIECLRLDAASWSLKVAQDNFTLQSRAKGSPAWLIRKGDYCHAAHGLHNTDPAAFHEPTVFKPDRHIKTDDTTGATVAELGSIRPFGGGTSMCKGRAYAYKELMITAAAIIALWEIEPAGGRSWSTPQKKRATAVYGVKNDIRVWLRCRLPTSAVS